jgi:hypothetical protein
LIRDRLVVGIRDTKLSETLQLDSDLSLQKAIEKITQAERIKNENRELREQNSRVDQVSRKNYSNQPRKGENKKMENDQRQHNEKTNECSRCGAKPRHDREKCPAKLLKCRKCKLVGHFAKFCRTKKISTVDANSEAQSEESEYTFMQVRSINSVHANKPYHVDLKISNEDFRFKIDTGADETIISLEDYNMKLRKK